MAVPGDMPDELLSNFRQGFAQSVEAFRQGDLDSVVQGLPGDLEWHSTSEDPERAVHRGPEQIKELFERFFAVFDEWRVDLRDVERISERALLADYVLRGTSRSAGVPVKLDVYEVWEFDGPRPFRVRQFRTREAALEATAGTHPVAMRRSGEGQRR